MLCMIHIWCVLLYRCFIYLHGWSHSSVSGRGLCPKWVEPSLPALFPVPNQKPLCLTEDLRWSPVHLPALSQGFAATDKHNPYVDTTVSKKCSCISQYGALVSWALSGWNLCVFVVKYTFHDAYVSVAFIDESILKKKVLVCFKVTLFSHKRQDLSY